MSICWFSPQLLKYVHYGMMGLGVMLGALIHTGCTKEGQSKTSVPSPPQVLVIPVIQHDVPIYSEWLGTTDGSINAQIRARVQGYLQQRHYREGTFVKAGELLFTIDPRPYQAALDQTKGDLGRAEAALGKTQLDVLRYTPLAKEGAISQQELDNAIQANRGNQATVTAARAAVKQAELDLEWTKIKSPISGIAGIADAQIGDLIEPSSLLTTVSQVDPIKVSFPISEREYLKFAEIIAQAMKAETRAEQQGNPIELILADGSVYPERGGFALPDREVDLKTGAITVVSYFPNSTHLLRPGLYAKVRIPVETKKGALLVPQRAVQELQGISRVAIVNQDDTVAFRTVQAGERIGSLWIIDEGLKAGEHVIVEGLQKVRDGLQVKAEISSTESVLQEAALPTVPPSMPSPTTAKAGE